jgi:hypothetical protein
MFKFVLKVCFSLDQDTDSVPIRVQRHLNLPLGSTKELVRMLLPGVGLMTLQYYKISLLLLNAQY